MATVKAIKYGMKGDEVSNLQTSLKNAGYNIDVDGSFGPQTLAAVKQYQQKNGLDVDGMVGPQTSAALFGGNTNKPAASTPANTTPTSGKASNNTSGETSEKDAGSGSAASAATKINYPDNFSYDDFSYGDYQQSETVTQAQAALDAALAAQPGAYQSKWQGQIDEMIDRILNREKFTYDINSDALYQQYADQYKNLGKLAMQDTMGQAAAMTGGYGNSYAQSVGQQAYQGYLSQLNEMVPELYGMALDQYNREGQEMYNQYGLLSDQEAQDYGRYRDAYNNWLAERDYAAGRYDSERGFDYSKYVDDRNYEYGKYSDDRNQAYSEYLDAVQQAQWGAQFDETVKQNEIGNQQWQQSFDETVKQNAIGNEQWDKSFGEQQKQNAISNSQWETSRQDKLNSEEKAYAREDVMSVISAGGTPTDAQLKAAGMSKETAAAMAAISSGNEEAALKHVGSMSAKDLIDTLETYASDGNNTAIEAILDDAFMTERIDEATYLDWRKKYLRTNSHTITDTTVATPGGPTGGGHGIGLAGVNNVIK